MVPKVCFILGKQQDNTDLGFAEVGPVVSNQLRNLIFYLRHHRTCLGNLLALLGSIVWVVGCVDGLTSGWMQGFTDR